MIIDFHTHTYPKHLTKRIVDTLSAPSGVKIFTDATITGLTKSCEINNVDKSIVLPVATNPKQTEVLNRIALETNETSDRLISFGAIHPDNADYRKIISSLHSNGIKGIKLHPVFQHTPADDIRYKRIIECACEYGMIMSIHAGPDISNPTSDASLVFRIRNMLLDVKPDKMILAHMGGHFTWDEAEDMIAEYKSVTSEKCSLYIDTAFCLELPGEYDDFNHPFIKNDQFIRICRSIGIDKVLWGTDSPWTDQGDSIRGIQNSGLTKEEISRILGLNARDLLAL